MKNFFILLALFALYDASATMVEVSQMQKTDGYDKRFELKTSLEEEVALDCQSFVQGLLFGPMGEEVILLQEWECEELMVDMKKSHRRLKKHCLNIDFDRSVMDSQQTCLP